jgi:protein O-mannosyl-transferase
VRSSEPPPARTSKKLTIAICAGLIALPWIVFYQTLHYGFVNCDDNSYVYENPTLAAGLSLRALAWPYTHFYAANWHPLTTVSYMLDFQLHRLNAGGYHFTNLVFHTATTVLLFLLLRNMTGANWRSAFVAAIFAIHPLHVESVAWISERKDVLSAFFFVLTLGAYARYARMRWAPNYVLVTMLFVFGLMSKPMLVTAPFVLLLMDYWPLNRFTDRNAIGKLLAEKIPLLFFSAASCVVTIFAQKAAITPAEDLPLMWRIDNALMSYVVYLKQTIWPTRLSVFYPIFQDELRAWQIAGAVAALVAITVAVLAWRRTRPYLLTGWFWYLGMLVPVIGIVQVGAQAHADRYMYLPQIGIAIAVVWGVSDLVRSWHLQRQLGFAIAGVITLLAFVSWQQTSFWRNGETLWSHALSVDKRNDLAHYGLGDIFLRRNEFEKAIVEFRAGLKIRPEQPNGEEYLGVVLLKGGRVDEAIAHFNEALRLMPSHPNASFDLGNALFQKGDIDGAIEHYQQALNNKSDQVVPGFVQPDYVAAHYNLGNCYIQRGDPNRAMSEFQEALKLSPDNAQVRNNLGFAFSQLGRTRQAVAEWAAAVRLDPKNIDALGNLVWVLATSSDPSVRDGRRAIELIEQAQNVSKSNPKILRVVAAAQAETGNFEAAVNTANAALVSANQQGDGDLVQALQSDLSLYESKKPLRD